MMSLRHLRLWIGIVWNMVISVWKEHREIYLNNANRTEKASLKTILRYKVTDIEKLQHTVIKEKRK